MQRKCIASSGKNEFLRTRVCGQTLLETVQGIARIDRLSRDCPHKRQRVLQPMSQLIEQNFRLLLSLPAFGNVFGNTYEPDDLAIGVEQGRLGGKNDAQTQGSIERFLINMS